MNIKRGEIYYVKKYKNYGTEQAGGRPFVVISPDELNGNGEGALSIPLTTKSKKLLPQHTTIHSTYTPSTVLCEQTRYVSEELFGDYNCTVTEEEMIEIEKCILEATGITGERLKRVVKEMGVFADNEEPTITINPMEKENVDNPTDSTADFERSYGIAKTMITRLEAEKTELTDKLSAKEIEIIKLQAQNEAYLELIKSKM